jgi:hypothetical protein
MHTSPVPAPIDPRGPRTNQAVLAVALVLGAITGQVWVVPVFAAVLFLGAAFGPRYGPVLRFYQLVIRPRLGPPEHLEDPRPPRFAAAVGVVFLVAATVAFVVGVDVVGWILALVVAALAALAAVTGLCVGCEMYVWLVRLRGGVRIVTTDRGSSHPPRRPRARSSRDRLPDDSFPELPAALIDGRETWVVFTTEYCAVCPSIVQSIGATRPDATVRVVDVAADPSLAARYRVRRAQTVVRADATGRVEVRLSGADAVRTELDGLGARHAVLDA